MKKPILQSVALASLAASPLCGAQAALISPSFSCIDNADSAQGGTVNWPYVTAAAPMLTFDFSDNTSVADISSNLDCSGGTFSEAVVARKAGEGQKDFLKVTLKEVLDPGIVAAIDTHIKFGFTQVLGELVSDVQFYDAYWDISGDYLSGIGNVGTPQTNFLGIKLRTTEKFVGDSSVEYDYKTNELTFSAELQRGAGLLSLTDSPRSVDEPGTLALLGTGLLGAAALRRRRRGW